MKNKISLLLLIIFLVILTVIFIYLLIEQRNLILNLEKKEKKDNGNIEIKITDKKIIEKTDSEEIEIIYPQIELQDGFNEQVEKKVKNILDEFKEYSSSDNIGPRPYVLNVKYEKGEISQDLVSIIFIIENYTGGAHSNTFFSSINYDIKNNKLIYLKDFFPNNSNYLKTISDFAIKDLTAQQEEKFGEANSEWILDGAGPKEENFLSFLVNKNNITFYFPPYQVAFYAAGYFKVIMPR